MPPTPANLSLTSEEIIRRLGPCAEEYAALLALASQRGLSAPVQHHANYDLAIVLDLVSRHFGVPLTDITSKQRSAHIADARLVYYYLAAETTERSLGEISAFAGRATHGAALHGIESIKNRRDTTPAFRDLLSNLKAKAAAQLAIANANILP